MSEKEYVVTFTATVVAENDDDAIRKAFEAVEMNDCTEDVEEV